MLVVTTDDIPGHTVRQVLGGVIGVTGRTRNPFKEGVRRLDGGGNPNMIKRLTEWRREAVEDMVTHAESLGANAVIGMRFDHRNVSDMWGEICAYGTAVQVEPAPRPWQPGSGTGTGTGSTPAEPTQPVAADASAPATSQAA